MPSAKCRFTETNVKFLGRVIDQDKVRSVTPEAENGLYREVAHASRTLSETERRNEIGNEGLAAVWESEMFRDFISGTNIQIERDHKPRVSKFSAKILDDVFFFLCDFLSNQGIDIFEF